MLHTTIEVTAEDIRLGWPSFEDRCPVARAVKRVVRRGFVVNADSGSIDIFPKKGVDPSFLGLTPPKRVDRFIEDFDGPNGRQKVQPFSFKLAIPKGFLRNNKP